MTIKKANTYRKTAIIVGVLFIIGTAAGVSSGVVTMDILNAPDYLNQIAANESTMVLGALLVLVMGFPLAMVPVMLFPLFRKQNEVLALGAIIFRGVLEAVSYILIVVSWLLLITLSQAYVKAGAPDASFFQTAGTLLMTSGRWVEHILAIVFSLGAIMIYILFYQTRLIPRWLSLWGLIGGFMYLAAPLVNVFDPQLPQLSVASGVGVIMAPLAIQEMIFALWLIIKGFNPAAVDALCAAEKPVCNVI
jgi:hypothetical protein